MGIESKTFVLKCSVVLYNVSYYAEKPTWCTRPIPVTGMYPVLTDGGISKHMQYVKLCTIKNSSTFRQNGLSVVSKYVCFYHEQLIQNDIQYCRQTRAASVSHNFSTNNVTHKFPQKVVCNTNYMYA